MVIAAIQKSLKAWGIQARRRSSNDSSRPGRASMARGTGSGGFRPGLEKNRQKISPTSPRRRPVNCSNPPSMKTGSWPC